MKFACSNLEAGKGGCTACHLQSVRSLGGLCATENRTVTLVNELLREVGLDVWYVECHHGVGCLMLFFVFGVVLYAVPPFVSASGSSLPRRQSHACIQPHTGQSPSSNTVLPPDGGLRVKRHSGEDPAGPPLQWREIFTSQNWIAFRVTCLSPGRHASRQPTNQTLGLQKMNRNLQQMVRSGHRANSSFSGITPLGSQ